MDLNLHTTAYLPLDALPDSVSLPFVKRLNTRRTGSDMFLAERQQKAGECLSSLRKS